MNQDDKEWAKGWRVVLTCIICEARVWSEKVDKLAECKCKVEFPNYIIDGPYRYKHGNDKETYDLTLEKVGKVY